MSDELLTYYKGELAFIRNSAKDFAEENPDVADGLNLSAESGESQDPHVERLIQAFAFLTARIRHKLDDGFPEVANTFLGMLYPHYQAPLPSMAIVEFRLDRGQATLADGYPIPRHKQLETEPVNDEPCYYRTCYPVTLWPIEVADASLSRPAVGLTNASAVLTIRLRCFAPDMTFAKLKLDSIRFYLNGQPPHVLALYELIFNHLVAVTVSNTCAPAPVIPLDKENVRPVGFEATEAVLPHSARSLPGYRLLTEYFAFPQKFYFFDLAGFGEDIRSQLGNEIEISLHLDRSNSDLEHNVQRDTFRLGCTAVVNLFKQRADPILFSREQSEYRVVPDQRRAAEACEIYSIEGVTGGAKDGSRALYQPFYSLKHATTRAMPQWFWFATRKSSTRSEHDVAQGTEVYLSLVELGFEPQSPADWVLDVDTICLNRNLPEQLPFGGKKPALRLIDGGPLSEISCLTAPTLTRRLPAGQAAMWRIISHLSLNHLSLVGGPESTDALREILRLYDYVGSAETQSKITGILKVASRRVLGRVKGCPEGGVCRGLLVEMEFDEERYSDNGLFLFASVLERFIGLYCEINSFTQLSVITDKQNKKRTLRTWRPRMTNKESYD